MDQFATKLDEYQRIIERDYQMRSDFIADYVEGAGAAGVVVGISGGIDSAVAAALAVKALGAERVLGIWMPVYSDSRHFADAKFLAEQIGIELITIDLTDGYNVLVEEFSEHGELDDVVKGNIKARMRMTALYTIAGQHRYLVSDTCNYSELYIGYMTKGGDGLADYNPLATLTKHQLRLLAAYLKLPDKIINKTPSADLWEGQTDEGEMGFSYYELDRYLLTGEGNPMVIKRIETLHRISEHKRNLIPGV
jgi:NAD+ synthase